MSKEIPKIDEELVKEFDTLIKEEGRKIKPEEQLKKALWGLDALKLEGRINSGTTLDELVQIVEERTKELLETNAYAKSTTQGLAVEEMSSELHDIAEKEAETAKRLLSYMESAFALLKPMQMSEYYLENTLKDVESRFRSSLKVRENQADYDEEKKRSGTEY
ncbi:MAG: hypothetical protein UT29_C0004G0017 [Candidatus Yanofskybacteria bacterium GW2011_GWA1_39_13]|uniref:Uncharacterized protein n=1 Tax=Yanofskybacteria sp. (strain GW2011_GWA1_39_13) TaxID=1619019 RepID=A0A0G0ME26_YANXG|nr:MAG: hypothetical protein UT29_C0004G0017 [Candidatus Yanofskybacteria bacterium GW2011_GWA1_39_13]